MSLFTSTRVVAGRMSRNSSPCARPICSHWPMSVTKMRVRTTSSRREPARPSAASMLRSTCTAWAYASPLPTSRPSGPIAVVPETTTCAPMRTARE